MLLKKILSGIFIATFVVFAEWFSPFIWFLAVCGIAIFGNYELQKIIEEKEYRHSYKLITTFILLLLISTYVTSSLNIVSDNIPDLIRSLIFPVSHTLAPSEWKTQIPNNTIPVQSLILGVAFLLLLIVKLNETPRVSIGDVSFALTRIIYLGFFPSYIIMLRAMPQGNAFLLLILTGGAACDVMAFATGKTFGKTKLLPEISPNKTVEGAIGGTLSCMLVCFIGGYYLIGIPWYHTIILGLITAIISQMGDLIESLFKRDVGKKDSGDVIPGHGGILDRVDSYIFIAFPAYYYVLWAIF